ncbi:lipopolysaccharide biosynthesis protein [Elizabethkingia anophelis]|uniref:lipopolysaccharide biosynthesis protein n=1 Tax=Elizabethkingia anophelis TaxID=1117645 RepID=UPI00099958E6|nr:lipopolysaccharide biosynthesis protein [Elizabethkingia anophelis]MCT3720741.1 lipopolysaccharide biosynthesis protein [Elizabethkingia anophelis]MCT3724113.1 lipopolysaccharide biosynthesis protein [Elizabethkingia anophelis]MCT3756471.1 lipopolysaccharide biosynthesis protein [Elizabethkingia anophelis]MCT3777286.1 lipopolysaccharide biosynthesis protein [Elizabethkingia anophelis]MCT3784399.1 lipopolysaccharide biosynthesis protein [Elizabethkingia anophelis]
MELKKQAVRSTFWAFLDQFSTQLISFGINLILARLLMPEDFGTIALFGVVMNVASVLINGGLASSLVRTQNANDADFSTVFWFNILTSIFIYIIIYATTPWISHFYNKPILTSLIRIYAFILIIDSFVVVQAMRFVKELDFKTSFRIKLPSLILGGASGVLFAWYGFGVWSLVYSALIRNIISTLQYWFYSEWRPSFVFDRVKFKYHFSFGVRMTLSELLDVVFNNLYSIVIGKKFESVQLGYYDRADALKQLPVNNIANTLSRVSYPLFAKISHDNVRLKNAYQEMLKLVIFAIAPMISMMIIEAKPLIRFLLTDKWLPAVPYFQILSLAGLLYPIHAYNLNILQVKRRADLFLKLEIVKKALVIIVIFSVIPLGMYGLVWGQVVLSVITLFINTFYTGKFLNYNVFQQLGDLLPSISIAAVIGGLLWLVDDNLLYEQKDIVRLIIITILYLIIYISVTYLLKFREFILIKNLILKR